jgi:hypothetical protein
LAISVCSTFVQELNFSHILDLAFYHVRERV